MSARVRTRLRLAAALAAGCAVTLGAGCASVPSSGPVMYRVADRSGDDAVVGLNPAPPQDDADPSGLVNSFLLAGSSGATAPTQYETAQLFLTDEAREEWSPTGDVVVYSGRPEVDVDQLDAQSAQVSVSVTALARVDAHGTYTEASQAAPFTVSFSLTRGGDDQWRIDELEDGVFVPATQFANQFRASPVYFPTPDGRSWVPDQRWFPRSSWRTSAVEEVLNGPPEWLQEAVSAGAGAPPGTQLAVPTVSADRDGVYQVWLGEDLASLTESQLSLLYAQLSVTLSDGGVEPEIAIHAGDSRLAEPTLDPPALPATLGTPIALADGELFTVSDGQLTDFDRSVHLEGLDPTAIALGPGAAPVVVLDDDERIVRVADVESESGQQVLLTGEELAPPSVDQHRYVWSSDDPGGEVPSGAGHADTTETPDTEASHTHLGRVLFAHESGIVDALAPDWLRDRQVIGVRVAPDGARIAIVSRTERSTQVHVAGIVRNENHVPVQLTRGVEVAAAVSDVVSAHWSGETSLLLLTRDDGVAALYETGVGGLPDESGTTESVQELPGVTTVTAGVTDDGVLALTTTGALYQERPTGWGDPLTDGRIDAIAYPG